MNFIQGEKYLWKCFSSDQLRILEIASSYSISIPLAQVLLSRGFASPEMIDSYLFSSKEKDIFDTALLKDAQRAVDRINRAIEQKEKILIVGDYDVDGITSSALMMACLQPLGALVNFFIPHRVHDGYGLSVKTIKQAAQNNYKVVITVDNGITAIEQVDEANRLGIDVIITDHHRPHDHVPAAYAIVNPHQKDCAYPFKGFAGVGVSFKILSLLYEQRGLALPSKAYELLLLGTIADVVPLLGENRFWVRYGLQWINENSSTSFEVLKKNGGVEKELVNATDIGFRITPQINALGRLEDPRQGVQFLLGIDIAETERIGSILYQLNQVRKEIEKNIFNEVRYLIDSGSIDLSKENIIFAGSREWPPGVIGLVASRLVSEYGKPTFLFHLTESGLAKGSCRSIEEFNAFDALQSHAHLIKQFGGHSVAAGLSLPIDNLSLLKAGLEKTIATLLTQADLQQKISIDAQLTLSDLNQKFMHDMRYFEPFGAKNKEPLFHVKNVVQVQKPQLLKGAHVKAMIFSDGVVKPVIFFNRPELFKLLMEWYDAPIDIVAQVTENHWQGKVSVELCGIDILITERMVKNSHGYNH